MITASLRVVPARAEEAGYRFRHREVEPALREILGRAPRREYGSGDGEDSARLR